MARAIAQFVGLLLCFFLASGGRAFAQPVISSFAPQEGPEGTTVVITGSGFSPVLADNAVRFNGVAALVTAADAVSLTVIVPAGATSGPLEVTVSAQTAVSNDVFCVPASPPSSLGLVAHYPFSGHANDASGNGNNGSVTGAVLTSDPFGTAGSAYRFNGVSSFIRVPHSATLASPVNRLTLSAWVNMQTQPFGPVLSKSTGAPPGMYSFGINSGGRIYLSVNTAANTAEAPFTFCTNQWYQVTVVVDHTIAFFYVDGTLVGSQLLGTPILSDLQDMEIGRQGSDYFDGAIDEVRIYNRALSACEVAALFTPADDPVITSVTPDTGQIGTTVIIAGSGFNPVPGNNIVRFHGVSAPVVSATPTALEVVVPTGATTGHIQVQVGCNSSISALPFTVVPFSPTGHVIHLNGATDWVEVADNPALHLSSFTLEAWVSFDAGPNSVGIITKATAQFPPDNSFLLGYRNGFLQGIVNQSPLLYPWTPAPGQWYHVALSYNDATQVQTLFLNGRSVAAALGPPPAYDGGPLTIGAAVGGGSPPQLLHGRLEEVRIWSVARTQAAIEATLYVPLGGSEPNLVAYYNMDESGWGENRTVANNSVAGAALNGTTRGTRCTPVFTVPPVPALSNFAPATGPIGTLVTLNGTGFSTVPAENAVFFSGRRAQVLTATAAQLTVLVPAGAATGPVEVEVNCGRAVFSATFTVVPFVCPPTVPTGGNRDATFNAGVTAPHAFRAIGIQSTQRAIVSVGVNAPIAGIPYNGLVRLNTDGTVDNTFSMPANYFPARANLHVLPDDRILAVETGTEVFVRRLNANGTPDLSFNAPGFFGGTIHALAPQADGKVLVSVFDAMASPPDHYIYRLEADGALDATFTPYRGVRANVIRQLPSGSILAGGTDALVQLASDGLPDAAFQVTLTGAIHDLAVQPGGRIILVGAMQQINGVAVNGIARLNADGTLDGTFSSGNGIPPGSEAFVIRPLPPPVGGFAVAGRFTLFNDVVRERLAVIHADGSLRCAFDASSAANGEISDLAIQADGRIIAAGAFSEYDAHVVNGLVRVNHSAFPILSFAQTASHPTGPSPREVLLSDLNGDGFPDAAASVVGSGQLQVFFGSGAGCFNATQLFPAVTDAHGLAVADFNNDGLPDVALSHGNLNQVAILLNSAVGLQPPVLYTTGPPASLPRHILAGDLNGDGRADLVAANNNSPGSISALLNQGGGVFSSPLNFPTTQGPVYFVAVADFNADGRQDVATANFAAGSVSLLVNDGAGGFLPEVAIPVRSGTHYVVARDLNADGAPDIATANATDNSISILLNSGSGSFLTPVHYASANYPTSIAIADMHGDGPPDLVVGNALGGSISVFPGSGTGTFGPRQDFPAAGQPYSMAVGDLTGDGRPDVAATNLSGNALSFFYSSSFSIPAPPAALPVSVCAGAAATLVATGGAPGQYRWYTDATGPTLIAGQVNDTFTTPPLTTPVTYFVALSSGGCESSRVPVAVTVETVPNAPAAAAVTVCEGATATLTATGGAAGQFRWYTAATGGTPLPGETNAVFITPPLTSNTDYFVAVNNGACESARTAVAVTVQAVPAPPAAAAASVCSGTAATLTATGGAAGQFRWFTTATGGTPLPGETNAVFITPPLTSNTDYFVAVNNGACESARTPVAVTVHALPARPVITASGPLSLCAGQSVVLSAPAGFASYAWSNGATTSQITVSADGVFTVVVRDANGCSSPPSDAVAVSVVACVVNRPPVFATATVGAAVNGRATIRLADLISDPDNNLDEATLRVVVPPLSGARVTFEPGFVLVLNYENTLFAGRDELVVEICDLVGLCVQQRVVVNVEGDIEVFNGISPNGDLLNDMWVIQNIETLPDTRSNRVSIFNRWGDLIWTGENYDNRNVVFTGLNRNGNEVPSGTYFYRIEFSGGRAPLNGFLTVRR
jgi:gliding motility-associated-like protein/uncharacterized delta-60 repeat protein